MDSPMTLVIKYGNRGCAKTCSIGFTREELMAFVVSKWDGLGKQNVYLSYELFNVGELDLANEEDMNTMFRLMSESQLHRVNVFVRKIGGKETVVQVSQSGRGSVYEIGESSQVSSVVAPRMVTEVENHQNVRLSEGWRFLIVGPGQRFPGGAVDFRKSLIKFAIEMGFEFDYVRNGPRRVTAVCRFRVEKGCHWRINAVLDTSDYAFVISFYERNHTCGSSYGNVTRRRLNFHIVADLVVDDIRSVPGFNPRQVQSTMKRSYGIDISYSVAWKALEKGRNIVFGDHTSSYGLLPLYFEELLRANPGSYVDIEVAEDMKFSRCFVAFQACLVGFAFCRPLIFIDGTFLKGRHRGCLLSAVSKDGDGGLYPICFGVVNEETDDNWDYFFRHLKRAVGDSREIVFISDRSHGILKAVRTVFNGSYHGYCYNHLKTNLEYRCRALGKKDRSLVLKFFQKCAYALSEDEFEENAGKMVNVGRRYVEAFLRDTPKDMWARAYFKGSRYGEMTSNASESWNSQIREERMLPIVSMLDGIRAKLMEQISKRRQVAGSLHTNLCRSVEVDINMKVDECRGWDVRKASDIIWEVFSIPSAVVDIEAKTCTCKMWQMLGVPCVHAVAVLYLKMGGAYQYVDRYFHLDAYQSTYANAIFPFVIPGQEGRELVVQAPEFHQTRGRPKRRRMASQGEIIPRRIRCGNCGELGNHNRQTCRRGPIRG